MSLHLEEQQFTGPVTVFTCSEIYGERVRVDQGEVQSVLHCFSIKIDFDMYLCAHSYWIIQNYHKQM